jgi:alpha-galactosidase
MRDALNATGKPIFYSICNWGFGEVWEWGNATGNSWRTTSDINDSWESIVSNFRINAEHPDSAGPGGWNDPDMLEVGNGNLTLDEEKTHFALWAFVKAPLIIGNDLLNMTNDTLNVLSNEALIRLN